jgi:16S rRNA (uracil1498-N3)-methyltransferase
MKHVFRATIDHDPQPGGAVTLPADDGRHLVRVARLGQGDAIEVIDAQGRIWPSVIENLGPPVLARVADQPRPCPPVLPLDLYLGALEWGRFDLVVEKCTEIGVARITMFTSERGGKKADQEGFDRRRERLSRLSDAAAKQSGQGHRPELRGLVPFSAVIDDVADTTGFLVDARGERPLGETLRAAAPERAAIVVGADAGFSERELMQARGAGLAVCSLGASMLRAETAALVAAAIAADGIRGR